MTRLLPLVIIWTFGYYTLIAQYTVTVNILTVGYSNLCDLDGFGQGDSDPRWVVDEITDNRDETDDSGSFGFDNINGTASYPIASTNFDVGDGNSTFQFSKTYVDICPPNFMTITWQGYDSDIGVSDGFVEETIEIPVPTTTTISTVTRSLTSSDCSGNLSWSMTFQLVTSGTPDYLCQDEICDADIQPIQDGCSADITVTRYDVSTSTSSLTTGNASCDIDGTNDIFFMFTAPVSGEIVINMSDYGDFGTLFGLADLTLNLYEGSCSTPALVDMETYNSTNVTDASATCIDLSGGITNSNFTPIYLTNLTPNQTYYIRATEEEDNSAFADLSFQAIVENDFCTSAIDLGSLTEMTAMGCNYNATDRDEPDVMDWTGGTHTGTFGGDNENVQTCAGWNSNENMVWYSFEVTDVTDQPIILEVESGSVDCEGGAETLQMGIWYAGNGPTYTCDLSDYTGVGCDVDIGQVRVELPNDVPNGRYYTVMDGNAGSQCTWTFVSDQILPVELLSFSGSVKNGQNSLSWATATEINNDYFIIERSEDGFKSYDEIGRVDGQGHSNNVIHYTYVDKNPLDLGYYRLRQVDFDGAANVSQIIQLRKKSTSAFAVADIYPNPASDIIHIPLETERLVHVMITIKDMRGATIRHMTIDHQGNGDIKIDTKELTKGFYTVHINNGHKVHIQKLIIQ